MQRTEKKELSELQGRLKHVIESSQRNWFAVEELVKILNKDGAEVRAALVDRPDVFLQSSKPDPQGRHRFSTRRHYRETHSFGERLWDSMTTATTT